MKTKILKWLRRKIAILGEYCNNNPYDKATYGLYLTLIDIIY